jgi:hypothetical protein
MQNIVRPNSQNRLHRRRSVRQPEQDESTHESSVTSENEEDDGKDETKRVLERRHRLVDERHARICVGRDDLEEPIPAACSAPGDLHRQRGGDPPGGRDDAVQRRWGKVRLPLGARHVRPDDDVADQLRPDVVLPLHQPRARTRPQQRGSRRRRSTGAHSARGTRRRRAPRAARSRAAGTPSWRRRPRRTRGSARRAPARARSSRSARARASRAGTAARAPAPRARAGAGSRRSRGAACAAPRARASTRAASLRVGGQPAAWGAWRGALTAVFGHGAGHGDAPRGVRAAPGLVEPRELDRLRAGHRMPRLSLAGMGRPRTSKCGHLCSTPGQPCSSCTLAPTHSR